MNENNPVLHAMRQELHELRGRYHRQPSDFGHPAGRPTHPELLDWLASEFVRSGFSKLGHTNQRRFVRNIRWSEARIL